MDSQDNSSPHDDPPQQPARRRWKPFSAFWWAPALLVLLLALSTGITDPTRGHLKSVLVSRRHLLKPIVFFRRLTSLLSPRPPPHNSTSLPPCVLWMAPFLSGGGYSSEAWSYVTALDKKNENNKNINLAIEHHGDLENPEFWDGLPEISKKLALRLHNTRCRMSRTVVICHSEPGAWYPPLFQTLPCPPTGYGDAMAVVGRTMFETDRLGREHVRRCNRMDAVWVPTEFHVSTFVNSGVDPAKVVKVVQAVDVDFFDPDKYEPMAIPAGKPVVLGSNSSVADFVFLSIFKWEYRKGWDVLLTSYLMEFSAGDGVALYLLTNPFHSDKDFAGKITKFVEDSGVEEPTEGWAPIYVIDTHIPEIDLPRIYKAADAFVLPSRGEGWGRPVVEAMAMSLPVITTNWSGPTEYLTEENGYPIAVDRMSEVVDGPFKGHLWAEPSREELRVLMRRVVRDQEEARRRGKRAREDMVRRFSPEVVADLVIDQILKISREG